MDRLLHDLLAGELDPCCEFFGVPAEDDDHEACFPEEVAHRGGVRYAGIVMGKDHAESGVPLLLRDLPDAAVEIDGPSDVVPPPVGDAKEGKNRGVPGTEDVVAVLGEPARKVEADRRLHRDLRAPEDQEGWFIIMCLGCHAHRPISVLIASLEMSPITRRSASTTGRAEIDRSSILRAASVTGSSGTAVTTERDMISSRLP